MRIALLLLLLTSACAATYKPQEGNSRGYSDVQVNTDSFIVGFKGGQPLRTKELALLRSAEVCLAKEFRYFVVTQVDDLSTVYTYSINSMLPYVYSAHDYYLYHHGGQIHTIKKPHFVYTIVCYSGKPETPSYDARMVLENMSSKHGL